MCVKSLCKAKKKDIYLCFLTMAFANYTTIETGDRFYLRFCGSAALMVPENSGWLCRGSEVGEVAVIWAADTPDSAILWQTQSQNPGSLRVSTSDAMIPENLVPGDSGTIVLRPTAGPNWILSRFAGYSNNQVPGFGVEPNFFSLAVGDARTTLATASGPPGRARRVYLDSTADGNPMLLSLLYWDGPRDNLSAPGPEALVCFNLRAIPQMTWLGWSDLSSFGLRRRAVLVDSQENAEPLQTRSLLPIGSGASEQQQFALAVVASPWVLGADSDPARSLLFGTPGGELATVGQTSLLTAKAEFRLGNIAPVSAVIGTLAFSIVADEFGGLALTEKTDPRAGTQQFQFVLQQRPRLQLGFADILAGHVGIVSPFAFKAQNSVTIPEPIEIVGQRRLSGCASLSQFELNWAPELVPSTDIPRAVGDCFLRWTSGNVGQANNPNNPYGNQYFISSSRDGQYQTVATLLRTFPMQSQTLCFVDLETGRVPAMCGSVLLKPFQSNLGLLPTGQYQDFMPGMCQEWAAGPLSSLDDEGLASVFTTKGNLPASPCQSPAAQLASTELVEFTNDEILAVVIPQNLLLQIGVLGTSVKLRLGPGSYSAATLRLINPDWPLNRSVPLEAYCCTVNPRNLFIAKMCSGFAGPKSSVYVPQSSSCNDFMRARCTKDQLFNSSVCGCFQDQARIQSAGLVPDADGQYGQ